MVVAVLPQSIKAIIQHSIEKSSFFSFIFQFFLGCIYMQLSCQKFICKNRAKNLYARTVPKIYMQEPCQKFLAQM
jgi:uncharacterized protein with PQ loop repeat